MMIKEIVILFWMIVYIILFLIGSFIDPNYFFIAFLMFGLHILQILFFGSLEPWIVTLLERKKKAKKAKISRATLQQVLIDRDIDQQELEIITELKSIQNSQLLGRIVYLLHQLEKRPSLSLQTIENLLSFGNHENSDVISIVKKIITWNYVNYLELGDLEKALTDLELSSTLFDKVGMKFGLVWNLFYLISLNIEMNSLGQAQHHLQRLQQIHEQEESPLVKPIYQLAKAMLLKVSPRVRDKGKAQDILLKLVEEDLFDVNLKIVVMLNLCESLLDELKAYEEKTVFQEALDLTQQIYSLAQRIRSFPLTIKLLLLQAKFVTIEGDLEAALNYLEQARTIAEDKGLVSLAARVDTENRELETQYDKWQQLIQSNAPFGARFKQFKLEKYLIEAKRVKELLQFK